jgi:hypothetical protein
MLIDKGIAPGEIISIKTVGGEEILAKLVEENDTVYKLKNPMVIAPGPQGLGLVPFMFSVDLEKEITVNKSAVLSIANTERGFADQFIQGTTGITPGVPV